MADISTNHSFSGNAPRGVLKATAGGIMSVLRAVGGFFVKITETNSRVRQMERLNSMSDAQLAARGLKREEIARHVFLDTFYV